MTPHFRYWCNRVRKEIVSVRNQETWQIRVLVWKGEMWVEVREIGGGKTGKNRMSVSGDQSSESKPETKTTEASRGVWEGRRGSD